MEGEITHFKLQRCMETGGENCNFFCKQCPSGHFSNGTSSFSCTPCSPGYFQPNESSSTCSPCALGLFNSHSGHDRCSSCGFFDTTYDIGQSKCILKEEWFYVLATVPPLLMVALTVSLIVLSLRVKKKKSGKVVPSSVSTVGKPVSTDYQGYNFC